MSAVNTLLTPDFIRSKLVEFFCSPLNEAKKDKMGEYGNIKEKIKQ